MSACSVPGYYVSNPPRTVIRETHPAALDAMAQQVSQHCQVGKASGPCYDAVATYASHNQAAASNVYGGAKPTPTVATSVIHPITPTTAINAKTYTDLVNVSNAQAVHAAATGEFHMWSSGPCNPCFFPKSDIQAATF